MSFTSTPGTCWPGAGLLVTGGALSALNPVYGQGITVAALQAVALRRMLAGDAAPDARRYFRQMARVIDAPRNTAVGADRGVPGVSGQRTLSARLNNAYIPRLHAAAAADQELAAAFIRVAGLADPPLAPMRPDQVARVLTAALRRQATARSAITEATLEEALK